MRFVRSPSRSTSPPSNRRILHPPAAAPAAGGWGISDSRCVHSVGACRVPAGGAEVTAVRSVWSLGAAPVPAGGGAPGRSAAARPPLPRPQFPGAAWCGFPSPEFGQRRLRLWNKRKMLMWSRSTALAAQDGGSPELSSGVSPSAVGIRPIQGFRGEFAAAMHWRVLLVAGDVVEVQRDCFVIFFFFLDWFVRPLFF